MADGAGVMENGVLTTDGERIGYVGEASGEPGGISYDREIDAKGNLLMPGFKNAHTHSGMTFLRYRASPQQYPAQSPSGFSWPLMPILVQFFTSSRIFILNLIFIILQTNLPSLRLWPAPPRGPPQSPRRCGGTWRHRTRWNHPG